MKRNISIILIVIIAIISCIIIISNINNNNFNNTNISIKTINKNNKETIVPITKLCYIKQYNNNSFKEYIDLSKDELKMNEINLSLEKDKTKLEIIYPNNFKTKKSFSFTITVFKNNTPIIANTNDTINLPEEVGQYKISYTISNSKDEVIQFGTIINITN